MKQKKFDQAKITLPPHVYETFEAYRVSPDYRPTNAISSAAMLEVMARQQSIPKPRCWRRHDAIFSVWVSEWQTTICLICHPTLINPRGAVILSWLEPGRRTAYRTFLAREQQR